MLYKYHGCGNDFIIVEYRENVDFSELTRKVCNRYIGIGADTLIVVRKTPELEVQFYNADGTIAPMCGNGIRCAAAYFKNEGCVKGEEAVIKTMTGYRKVYYCGENIMINMGYPSYEKEKLDLDYSQNELFDTFIAYNDKKYNLNAIFFTTHHLVIPVDELNISDECASYFCNHPLFLKKINVNFVKIIDRKNILVKTYERGVGWTKACGSGTTSSVAVLIRKGLVDDEVVAKFQYGELIIKKKEDGYYMAGPAKMVASGIVLND